MTDTVVGSDRVEPVSVPAARPRIDGDREGAIFEGVVRLLVEVGYDKLTFDMVAAEVKASKATLYRRWPTKVDLVISALDQIAVCPAGRPDLLDTGTLEGDLEQLICADPEWTQLLPGIVRAIVPALHREADLTAAFNLHFMQPRQGLLVEVLRRAQCRGEIGKDADLEQLGQILPALAVYHAMVTGSGPDTTAARAAIETVLLPACRATMTAGPTSST
ncbi:TetR/AcrR family transcriptional regulator [Nakamurella lactea]|uniref:TetR/AcrR family transcriptional regulator n=1 Tax=Nakamurella lactea TaxID=459515 RepID=UPI0003FABD68|nr:TetR/AcrR family transcriptional regulator [Nakamurella lactea]